MQESQPPKFLNAQHIKNVLQISYSEASNLLEQNVLPVVILGNSRRVLAKDFYKWLQSKTSNIWVT
jgi:hypothetical protein